MYQANELVRQLAGRRCFVLAKLVRRENGKTDKIPVNPEGLHECDGQDPANWLTGEEAEAHAARLSGRPYGVGVVLGQPSGLACIDLDHSLEGGVWKPYVAEVMARFPGCYFEVSQSMTAAHLFFTVCPMDEHHIHAREFAAEVYSQNRFIFITGTSAQGDARLDHTLAFIDFVNTHTKGFKTDDEDDESEWRDGPAPDHTPIVSDEELITKARHSRPTRGQAFGGKATFSDLFDANEAKLAQAYPPQGNGVYDGSSADLALAGRLAFWTSGDHERVAKLMRESALVRPKWNRADYFRGTIAKAVRECPTFYGAADRAPQPPAQAQVVTPPSAVAAAVPHFMSANNRGKFEATLENLNYLLSGQQKTRIGFDTFRDRVMIAPAGTEAWRPLTDTDMIQLRETVAREQNFAAIGKELMADTLRLVAERHKFDSAIVWLSGLVWDGVPRVERFLATYCGSLDDEYSRAVSLYIWTGLAERVLVPGCQLDMVVAMQSPQGKLKSTGLQSMVPDPEFFTDGLDLHEGGDDFKRLLRGKLVIEIAEMAGLSKADVNLIKRTITRRVEEWVEKYHTQPTRFPRRCMLFATTNEESFLPRDETGHRRWLPVQIEHIDREAITRDRDQLWAEGAAIYRERGQLWAEAERLAAGRHAAFEQRDVWEHQIAEWLDAPAAPVTSGVPPGPPPGSRPLSLGEVLSGALRLSHSQQDMRAEKRAGTVLRQLGFEVAIVRLDGKLARRWVRSASQGAQGAA